MLNLVADFRRLPRDIQLISWTLSLVGVGYFGIFSVLFNLYLLRLGHGPEMIGLLVGAGQLAWGCGAIPAGILGGRMGNRRALIWGMGVSGASYGLLLLSEFLSPALQTPWITTWWIVSWLGGSLVTVNISPWMMEIAAPEQRSNAFTAMFALQNAGGFLGSLLAGILPGMIAVLLNTSMDSTTVYWLPLWLSPVVFLGGCWLLTHTTPRSSIHAATTSSHFEKIPYFLLLFVATVVFLQTLGEGMLRSFFNIYLNTALAVPVVQIGIIMGLGQALPILSTLGSPWVLMRWKTGFALILVSAGNALCLLVLAFITTWLAASLGYIGFMMIGPIAGVVRTLFSQEIVPERWRTTMSTAFNMGNALGWAVSAALGGFLITGFGFSTLFFWGALTAVISGFIVFGYLRMGARAQSDDPGKVSTVG